MYNRRGMEPRIVHFDLDAFFAAVEVLLDPALAGKPVIVGAEPGSRGVVATASYEARAYGVHSAMPIGHAYRLCPDGVYVRPRHGVYSEHSRKVMSVVGRYSERVQPVSIDEAFVALDGAADPVTVAREMKAAIREETGLVASLGVAASKLVAKVASDLGKPDGFVVVAPGSEESFLAPLPVRKLWGVGPKTAERLRELNIHTVGDLTRTPAKALAEAFGSRHAVELQSRARGRDGSQVEASRAIKSISDEMTFQRDEADPRALWRVLVEQCQQCAGRLAKKSLLARTVTLKVRYADFSTITRSVTLPAATDDSAAFQAAVGALMRETWAGDRRPLRLVGVKVSGLWPEGEARQLALW